jgi:two-component system, LytTR family, sensor kinase
MEIFEENNYLVVKNNLQRKTVSEPSTGLGLHNIVNRYKLLSEKTVDIVESETHFSVYIPLLKGVA